MIDSKDVTVVIQGAFHEGATTLAIDMLKSVLPGCEIIVSAWEGSPVRVDSSVRLVLNEDPGPSVMIFDDRAGVIKLDNCNRQIVSTMGGVRVASRPYVAKLRSDMLLRGRGFLDQYEAYQKVPRERPFFKKRIVCNSSGTVDPRIGSVAHPGDFFFFGLAEDIHALYSAPLYTARQMDPSEWIGTPVAAVWRFLGPNFRGNFCPEMHLWSHQLQEHYGVEVRSIFDYSQELVDATLDSFADNLIPLDDDQIGLDAQRHRGYARENYWRNFDNRHFLKFLGLRNQINALPLGSERPALRGYEDVAEYKEYVANQHGGLCAPKGDRMRYRSVSLRSRWLRAMPSHLKRTRGGMLKLLKIRHRFYKIKRSGT